MSIFRFKHFDIRQSNAALKVGTDAMVLGALLNTEGKLQGLDVGAGTGVLSLMQVQKNNGLSVEAVELDLAAFEECQLNFQLSPWANRLKSYHVDFLSWNIDKQYDLIFSNPPYYQTTLESDDDRMALAKHAKGVEPADWVGKMSELLTHSGSLWLILPADDFLVWKEAFNKHQLSVVEKVMIIGKREAAPKRVVVHARYDKEEMFTQELVIREKDGKYSEEYIELTKDFHGVPLR